MRYNVVPRLKEILKERKMTQVQLEKLSGVPQGTISVFDRNKQHMDIHLVSISRALNISIEDLFHIEED
jgi:transcriptional regulator with XRE-family HTH domain